MIYESLDDLSSEPMHKLIDESRASEKAATTKKLYRDYTLGNHRPINDHARKAMLGSVTLGDVKENMIGRCIHELNGRIAFREFSVSDADVSTFLNLDVAAKNQMGRSIAALVPRMLTDGSAAMSVAWSGKQDGRPVLKHEQWWDGHRGMFVAVSDTGEVFWAVSEWYDSQDRQYRTVYRPHVIERYRLQGDGWVLQRNPIIWTKNGQEGGEPLGVPVAHFPNGASPYGPYPPSTVASVVDVQDTLNASLFNRQLASAMTGAQQYWASGVTEKAEMPVGAGQMWLAQNAAARFGAIPPGDLDGLIKECDDLRQVIGSEFSVPTYRIGQGEWPSGVALVRADAPMIKRVRLLIDMALKPGITYLAHRAIELKNAFGGADLDTEAEIVAEFEPPDEIDPGTRVEIDQAKADLYADLLNLPEVLLQKLDVLTDTELKKLVAYIKAQEEADAERVVAQAPTNQGQGAF